MNKYERILQNLEMAAEEMERAEDSNVKPPNRVSSTLVREAVEALTLYKYVSDEFAKSITITPATPKPRISVDIERFLAAQWTYNKETDVVQ